MKSNFSLILLPFLLFTANSIFAQNPATAADIAKVREILNSQNFRIDILNVVREGAEPVAIYSTNSVEIKNSIIKAKFPYFFRDDNPKTASVSDIKLNYPIEKIKIKENKKKGIFVINILTLNKNKQKYQVLINIDYYGYCIIYITNPQKEKVMYDGRLKI